ncbi:GL26623 [Drosophila persimilis]|uniref:GL26623 n=1 Tax=Drosophila persimilis TaxID=7234 RepID=B4GUT7_DROPE|nr:GL26623 [Drosophila persimilis]
MNFLSSAIAKNMLFFHLDESGRSYIFDAIFAVSYGNDEVAMNAQPENGIKDNNV